MSFYTDIICKDRRFKSTSVVQDPKLLEPEFREKIQDIIDEVHKTHQIVLRIGETYRSQERQEQLFMKGATQLRSVGVHHYGLACDLWIMIGGQVNWKADYTILMPYAEKYQLIWGGDWNEPNKPHTFRDYDHLQAVAVADQSKLFAGTWYPDKNYNPLV